MPTKASGTRSRARPPSTIGEDADGHHGEDMVEPADRVHEAVQQAGRVADAGMGEGRGRGEDEQQASEQRARIEYLLAGPTVPHSVISMTAGLLAPDLDRLRLPSRKPVAR